MAWLGYCFPSAVSAWRDEQGRFGELCTPLTARLSFLRVAWKDLCLWEWLKCPGDRKRNNFFLIGQWFLDPEGSTTCQNFCLLFFFQLSCCCKARQRLSLTKEKLWPLLMLTNTEDDKSRYKYFHPLPQKLSESRIALSGQLKCERSPLAENGWKTFLSLTKQHYVLFHPAQEEKHLYSCNPLFQRLLCFSFRSGFV